MRLKQLTYFKKKLSKKLSVPNLQRTIHRFVQFTFSGEFWLGLEKIYSIVKQSNYILRIELEDWKDSKHYIDYSFHLGNHETNYTLHLVEITGNIPKVLPEHKDLVFSTWDHKSKGHFNCPESFSGILSLTSIVCFPIFKLSNQSIS